MRKAVRVVVLVVLSMLSTVVLVAVTALTSAVSLAATALIVPGTGTPNANIVSNYMENVRDRYLAPYTVCTDAADCRLQGINYPASFFPFFFFPNWCVSGRCEKWDVSVGEGVTNLDTALRAVLASTPDTEQIVIFGYSQGGQVVSNALRNIDDLTAKERSRLSVVMIGNAANPDGGLFTRLGFLGHVPILDATFGLATPVDTGLPMTTIGFEYDPVMYAPLYWGNLLAVLNAFAAFDTVHGYYLTPNGNGPTDSIAYGYTDAELAAILATPCPGAHCRVDSFGNDYYMIPAKSLPIMDLITSLVPGPVQPFVKPILDLISPAAEVLINLGYDWSGDPGVPRALSILPFNPFQNWVQVGADLAEAVGEGVENAFGGSPIIGPLSDTPTISVLSAPAAADPPTDSPAPQVLSTTSLMTSPSTNSASGPIESLSAGAPGKSSTATGTGEPTPAETNSIALKSVSEPKAETPSPRRTSGNLFRPGAVTADTSPSGAQPEQSDGRPTTTSTNGATTAGPPSSATGGAPGAAA